jgi:hypothetical protein
MQESYGERIGAWARVGLPCFIRECAKSLQQILCLADNALGALKHNWPRSSWNQDIIVIVVQKEQIVKRHRQRDTADPTAPYPALNLPVFWRLAGIGPLHAATKISADQRS